MNALNSKYQQNKTKIRFYKYLNNNITLKSRPILFSKGSVIVLYKNKLKKLRYYFQETLNKQTQKYVLTKNNENHFV